MRMWSKLLLMHGPVLNKEIVDAVLLGLSL